MKAVVLLAAAGFGIVASLPPSPPASQGQPPATFSSAARTVAVYATVRHPDGSLVPDLKGDAFEISDNGKKQTLTQFAHDVRPITVVMLLDRSGSMRGNFRVTEKAAEAFIAAMGPEDRARIGSFADRIQIDPREFTSDHETLLTILQTDLQTSGPTPLWNALNVGITALLHEQGRRVILVFTDGADNPQNSRGNNSSLKDVMKRADEEDVMVYAVGLASRGTFSGGRNRPGWAEDRPDEGLPKIAAATGGGYFELTTARDLVPTFERVANELHHQYLLGFTPPNLDGKMHSLSVRVVSPAGLFEVRARRSYLARKTLGS